MLRQCKEHPHTQNNTAGQVRQDIDLTCNWQLGLRRSPSRKWNHCYMQNWRADTPTTWACDNKRMNKEFKMKRVRHGPAYAHIERPSEGDATETKQDHGRKELCNHWWSGNKYFPGTEQHISSGCFRRMNIWVSTGEGLECAMWLVQSYPYSMYISIH